MIHRPLVFVRPHGKFDLNLVRSERRPLLELEGKSEALARLELEIPTVNSRLRSNAQ